MGSSGSDINYDARIAREAREQNKLLKPLSDVLQPLTFRHFSRQNLKRACRWHGGSLADWSVSEWAVAAGGEMGEVLDAIKKLNRIEHGIASNNPRQPLDRGAAEDNILKEIGDTGVYLDLLAQRLGSDLGTCMQRVFNSVSERENMPERV